MVIPVMGHMGADGKLRVYAHTPWWKNQQVKLEIFILSPKYLDEKDWAEVRKIVKENPALADWVWPSGNQNDQPSAAADPADPTAVRLLIRDLP